jgi:L-seryl-tRNA(Ser) seleniumtransferase
VTNDAGNNRLRGLPSVDRVITSLAGEGPARVVAAAARQAVDDVRVRILDGEPLPAFEDIVSAARTLLTRHRHALLREVINATGVIIHTNLGRAPLGVQQLDAVRKIAGGYSNLEYNLDKGTRGSRYTHARQLIGSITGAESALVVNNNAAAVLLVLTALCAEREVVISRGELIEIGGEFRLPDVMNTSRAILREVGTTNRTHLGDYERAISPSTAAIMKVHPSNFRVIGFTSDVPAVELARLARGRGVLFINDLGSGLAIDTEIVALRSEPLIHNAIEVGADIVTFSGDKLLGGPQAGVIAGRADLIERLANHPLLRALRVDKMTLAALEATLNAYLGDEADDLPVWQMLNASEEELRERAARIALAVDGVSDAKAEVVPMASVAGGGSAPVTELHSWGIAVSHPERGPNEIRSALRAGDPPVVCRSENDRILLDVRTVAPDDDERLITELRKALGRRMGNG